MIRCTIELVPFGDEEFKKSLGEIIIYNDMTGNHYYGNYKVNLKSLDKLKPLEKTGTIKKHDRQLSVFYLVKKALINCLKNPKQLKIKNIE